MKCLKIYRYLRVIWQFDRNARIGPGPSEAGRLIYNSGRTGSASGDKQGSGQRRYVCNNCISVIRAGVLEIRGLQKMGKL